MYLVLQWPGGHLLTKRAVSTLFTLRRTELMPARARLVSLCFVLPPTAGRMAQGTSGQPQPGARASQERFRPACQAAQGANTAF